MIYPDTVERRYRDDVYFKSLVDMLESFVHRAQYSPSEMRAAAVLACIHYEFHRVPHYSIRIPADLEAEMRDDNGADGADERR